MKISWFALNSPLDRQNLVLVPTAGKEVSADALCIVCTRESKPSKYRTILELQAGKQKDGEISRHVKMACKNNFHLVVPLEHTYKKTILCYALLSMR
jgi:hypothetical protein